ncbi:hypothetical protein D039_3910A, partial [Vibrio parahaemolyticus EKP-028]
MAIVINII